MRKERCENKKRWVGTLALTVLYDAAHAPYITQIINQALLLLGMFSLLARFYVKLNVIACDMTVYLQMSRIYLDLL